MHANRSLARLLTVGIAVLFMAIVASVVHYRSVTLAKLAEARAFAKLGELERVSLNQGSSLSLKGGVDWINSGPISLAELKGKIVLLDFWTFCCINCHHILPHLAELEAKYKNELVVIGVHTAKFPAERDTENIRRKVAEYRIKHPVVNDANQTIWHRFGVNSWPTLILIDANGKYVDRSSGEGNFEAVDRVIGQLVEIHKTRGELNLTPLAFTPEMERPTTGPLLYPGKVVADAEGKRLFIADTGHNRIVQTDLEGENPVTIGSGEEGFDDGDYKKASFNRPQGMFLKDDTLYVADTENHAIRAVDLKEATVTTIAGTGKQAPQRLPARVIRPCQDDGPLQPLGPDPDHRRQDTCISRWPARIRSGSSTWTPASWASLPAPVMKTSWMVPRQRSKFAQPSGLATDGENLFVADSEVSGVRVITGIKDERGPLVRTVVGAGLFEFDDIDGRGATVRLQHCLGLTYSGDHLYIADTYNNKIKICEPRNRTVHTFVGTHKAGDGDDPPISMSPAALSAAGNKLYVADTNNQKIKVVDLKTRAVKTLAMTDLTAPRLARRRPSFPGATTIDAPAVTVAPGKALTFAISLALPKGYKLNEEAPIVYLVETPEKEGIVSSELSSGGERISHPKTEFKINVPLAKAAEAGQKLDVKLSLSSLICSEPSSLCRPHSLIWNIPIAFSDSGSTEPIPLTGASK